MGKALVGGHAGSGSGIAWELIGEKTGEVEITNAQGLIPLCAPTILEGDWDMAVVELDTKATAVKTGGTPSSSDDGIVSIFLCHNGASISNGKLPPLAAARSRLKDQWAESSVAVRLILMKSPHGADWYSAFGGGAFTEGIVLTKLDLRASASSYGKGTAKGSIRIWGGKFQLPG